MLKSHRRTLLSRFSLTIMGCAATSDLNKVKAFTKKFVEEGKINSHESKIIMERIDKLPRVYR